MSGENSYRQTMRSLSIMGGASVINILIGLARTKAAAILLGPAGIGLIGLYTNLIGTASTVAGLGFGTVGTRQIAGAAGAGDAEKIASARRALFWGTMALAIAGAGSVWIMRWQLASNVLAKPTLADEVGWLALGVALTVAAASQNALLRGLRRVGDIARVSIISALLSSALGIFALLQWGRGGLLCYVLVAPLTSFMLGHWFVSRLPKVSSEVRTTFGTLLAEWGLMARVGFAFMVASLAATVGALVVRSLVQNELGAPALGQFQAAWTISMQYIAFVLSAMGTDFYPRLAAVIKDHSAVNVLVNDQSEVTLLLAAPLVIAMIALAPWLVTVLYTSEFSEAVGILRWQLLADVLKLVSWPIGFILLAANAGKLFFFSEWTGAIVFASGTYVLLPLMGVDSTGVSFLLMYSVNVVVVYTLARRRTGFRWRRSVVKLAFTVFAVATVIAWLSWVWPTLGVAAGLTASGSAAALAIRRLRAMNALPLKLERLLAKINHSK